MMAPGTNALGGRLDSGADLAAAMSPPSTGRWPTCSRTADPVVWDAALPVRGLAHPRGRGPRDHAGALRGSGIPDRAGGGRRRLHPALQHRGGPRRRAARRSPARPTCVPRRCTMAAAGGRVPAHSRTASSTDSTSSRQYRWTRTVPSCACALCSASSPTGYAQPLRRRPQRCVELRADDLDWSCGSGGAGLGPGAGSGPGGLRPLLPAGRLAATGPGASAAEGLSQLPRQRRNGCARPAACSTGTGRPARPVGQGTLPRPGSVPCPPGRPTR